jgi:hypothetical protein
LLRLGEALEVYVACMRSLFADNPVPVMDERKCHFGSIEVCGYSRRNLGLKVREGSDFTGKHFCFDPQGGVIYTLGFLMITATPHISKPAQMNMDS